jgi:hypothetical protein
MRTLPGKFKIVIGNLIFFPQIRKASEAYSLNPENWFKIGLTHNNRVSYSKLLEKVNTLLPMENLTVAFSSDSICFSGREGKVKSNIKKEGLPN